jgi:hypothetical protein
MSTDTEPRVEVGAEPLTYRPDTRFSYFRDLVLTARGEAPAGATARLERHAAEMDKVLAEREVAAHMEARAHRDDYELRVAPDRTQGYGGYFAPPLWLIDRFATAPRTTRVLAAHIPTFPLPQGVQEVNVPRLTTGDSAAGVADDTGVPARDLVDAQVRSPVVTISSDADAAIQLLEQSPGGAHLDWAIFKDLTASYDQRLETALLTGTGAGGQFYGLLNMPGALTSGSQVTYTDSTPTISEMWPFFGQAAAGIGNNRLMPPEMWLMRTARWAWIGTQPSASNYPLSYPGHTPPGDIPYLFDDNRPTPVTCILGWPVFCDDAIPATLGAASNQDVIVLCRPTDMLLLESSPRTRVMFDTGLSGTLQARLQLHGYVAALLGRYPSGIAVLNGTGFVVQSGYDV